MKTKLFSLSLIIGIAMCFLSCEHNSVVSQEQEKEVINTIYKSLDLTPGQFAEAMTKQGLHEIPQPDYMADRYKTFVNEDQRTNNTILVNINFRNENILQFSYERSLNEESNIAAYYTLFSDMIANHNYIDWHGYYEDPDTNHNVSHLLHGGNDYSLAQEASNRKELCGFIINEHICDTNTTQYFSESFIIDNNEKQWQGQTLMWSSLYFAGLYEGSGKYYKDISLSFILKQIGSDKTYTLQEQQVE